MDKDFIFPLDTPIGKGTFTLKKDGDILNASIKAGFFNKSVDINKMNLVKDLNELLLWIQS